MIGVVVWSSAARQKAVIWCEDHGALAYLQCADHLRDVASKWPEAGDLLELESETIGDMRYARDVALITEGRCPRIPELLLTASGDEPRLRLVAEHGERVSPAQTRTTRSDNDEAADEMQPVWASAGRC